MQQAGLMPSARSPLHPHPGTSLGAMAIPCFKVLEESTARPCMRLISDSLPSKYEGLSNAGWGWAEDRQRICKLDCCPTQMEQSSRTALAKDPSFRGHALPKGCRLALAVVPGLPLPWRQHG